MNELKELMESFLNYLKNKKKSDNTITSYRYDLIPFVEYFNNLKMDAKSIKPIHFDNYLSTLNCKASSMHRKISSIQSFFKYLKKMQYLQKMT